MNILLVSIQIIEVIVEIIDMHISALTDLIFNLCLCIVMVAVAFSILSYALHFSGGWLTSFYNIVEALILYRRGSSSQNKLEKENKWE